MKRQFEFFDSLPASEGKALKKRRVHGGSSTRGKRKLARPLNKNKPLHLVLKSKKAMGRHSFLLPANKQIVVDILKAKSRKFGVKIQDYANVGNHLHIKLRFTSREGFQRFLKAVTCLIARRITGARRGHRFGKFWDGLAFTRIVKTSFEELQLKGYFKANRIEAAHSPKKRQEFLGQFNRWLRSLPTAPAG
jgi:hypothetical protein